MYLLSQETLVIRVEENTPVSNHCRTILCLNSCCYKYLKTLFHYLKSWVPTFFVLEENLKVYLHTMDIFKNIEQCGRGGVNVYKSLNILLFIEKPTCANDLFLTIFEKNSNLYVPSYSS